jgi:hypothetical protein
MTIRTTNSAEDIHEELRKALRDLGEPNRTIVIQRELQAEPTPLGVLAKRVGLTRDAVRRRQSRSIEQLREQLRNQQLILTSKLLAEVERFSPSDAEELRAALSASAPDGTNGTALVLAARLSDYPREWLAQLLQ